MELLLERFLPRHHRLLVVFFCLLPKSQIHYSFSTSPRHHRQRDRRDMRPILNYWATANGKRKLWKITFLCFKPQTFFSPLLGCSQQLSSLLLCLLVRQFVSSTMARNVGFFICILILAMDVSAGILGIEAEIAQNKVKHLKMWIFECRDPSHTAFKFGLAACILLALAHVTANLLGGCLCVVSRQDLEKSSANKQLAVASLIFSWIILAIAFSMLIVGTMANSRSRKNCGISHHRVLSIGGILCFIHGLFAVAYYISATASRREQTSAGHA